MAEKPRSADEYSGSQSQLVSEACLYLATKLGDHLNELVVVGGMGAWTGRSLPRTMGFMGFMRSETFIASPWAPPGRICP